MSLDFDFDNFELGLGNDGYDDDDDDEQFCMAPIAPSAAQGRDNNSRSNTLSGQSNSASTSASVTASDRGHGDGAAGPASSRGRGLRRHVGQAPGPPVGSQGGRHSQRNTAPGGRGPGGRGRITQADIDSLNSAIRLGRYDTVETLLSKSGVAMPVDTPMPGGWSPLMCAASCAVPEMVALLLRYKPNVNYDCGKKTPLMVACDSDSSHEVGVQECVCLLTECGAKANVRDAHGMSPLMMAARKGRLAVCRFLLKHSAEISFADLQGNTALMWAAQCGHLPVARVLVMAGADVQRDNNAGETAESMAYSSDRIAVCDYLERVQKQQQQQKERRQYGSDSEDEGAGSAHTSGKVGQLQIFLNGLNLGHLVKLFEEHNVAFTQLANMSEDDLAKMGVVDGTARHAIVVGARRLARSPGDGASGGAVHRRAQHRHQMKFDDVHQLVSNLNQHVKFQCEATAYLLSELRTQPLNVDLIQEPDLKDVVEKSERLRVAASVLFESADELLIRAESLVDAPHDSDEETESSATSAAVLRSRTLLAAGIAIPTAAVATGLFLYAGRTGLISWS